MVAPSAHLNTSDAPIKFEDAPTKFEANGQELDVKCVYVPFIGTISMAESKFYARVDIDVEWVATQDDLRKYGRNPSEYMPSFVPDIVSLNGMGVSGSRIMFKHGNTYRIQNGRNFMRVRFEGEFIESFEMESFPFDVQALTFVFAISFFKDDEMRFSTRDPDKPFFFVVTRNSAFLEWTPVRLVAGIHVIEDFSTLVCQVQLKRDPAPYLLRIGGPCLVLNALSFSMFTSPEASERVNLALTLILTFVALIYTLTTLVPMASRATVADSYMFTSIIVTVLAVGLSVGACYAPDGPDGPFLSGCRVVDLGGRHGDGHRRHPAADSARSACRERRALAARRGSQACAEL